jgi:hypothetical protein
MRGTTLIRIDRCALDCVNAADGEFIIRGSEAVLIVTQRNPRTESIPR